MVGGVPLESGQSVQQPVLKEGLVYLESLEWDVELNSTAPVP